MEPIKKFNTKNKQIIVTPAIKPETRTAYFWKLPDEKIDRMLRKYGVDTDELNKILARGGGVITFNHAKTNQNVKEKA